MGGEKTPQSMSANLQAWTFLSNLGLMAANAAPCVLGAYWASHTKNPLGSTSIAVLMTAASVALGLGAYGVNNFVFFHDGALNQESLNYNHNVRKDHGYGYEKIEGVMGAKPDISLLEQGAIWVSGSLLMRQLALSALENPACRSVYGIVMTVSAATAAALTYHVHKNVQEEISRA